MVEREASHGVLVALGRFPGEHRKEERSGCRKSGKLLGPNLVRAVQDGPGSDAMVFMSCEEGVSMG